MRFSGFLARAVALTASQGVQDGIQALLMLWLARTNQTGYGLFVFGIGVALMVRSVLAMGLDQYTLREFSLNQRDRGRLLGQMLRLKTVLGVVILAGVAGFGVLKGWSSFQLTIVLIIAGGRMLDALAETFYNLFRAEGRQVREGVFRASANVAAAICGATLMLMGYGVLGVAVYVLIGNGLNMTLAMIGGRHAGLVPSWKALGRLVPAGELKAIAAVAGISVLGSFYNYCQVFLLKEFHPLTEVAVYGAANDMANSLSGLVSTFIIGAILFPSLAKAAADSPDKLAARLRGYLWHMVNYGIVLAFFLSTLGGWVLTLLFGEKYLASVGPLTIFGPATLLSFVNNLFIFAMLAMREERRLVVYHLLPAALALGLGLWVIPILGATGAAWNLLFCRIAMFILLIFWLQIRLGLLSWAGIKPLILGWAVLGGLFAALHRFGTNPAALAGLAGYGLVLWRRGLLRGPPPVES